MQLETERIIDFDDEIPIDLHDEFVMDSKIMGFHKYEGTWQPVVNEKHSTLNRVRKQERPV